MWAKFFFWAWVAFTEIAVLTNGLEPGTQRITGEVLAMAVANPFIWLGVRKLRRAKYLRDHTVFVKHIN